MDFNVIIQSIATIGFPCVMCLLIYLDNNKKIENMQGIISENTKVLSELKTLFTFIIDNMKE